MLSHVQLCVVGEPNHNTEDCGYVTPFVISFEFGDSSCHYQEPYIGEQNGEYLNLEGNVYNPIRLIKRGTKYVLL